MSVFGGGYSEDGSHIGSALVFGYRMDRGIVELAAESGSSEALERTTEVGAPSSFVEEVTVSVRMCLPWRGGPSAQ
ncbi:hypothetical protein GCM10010977_31810 [Citricoccus zhacaiensis]|uniref:Uncharacterized protein n=1 Tax=Citricoccus zhacaiensis TaxID=489142 RepID=A0ABQ2MCN9_9MICC|nr:hypothetical protein [Citricoccus zhacaiensis]GGO49583.1 hypothetical protein GCM10010977_31810 [Citricoccus zhacaiensis]